MLAKKKKFITATTIALLLSSLPLGCYCNWELAFQPRQRVVKSIANFNDTIFIGTGNGVQVSKDNGKTWKDFGSSQLEKDSTGNSIINWIYINEEKKRIYIASSYGAYYSNINIPNWKKLFIGTKADNETHTELLDDDIDDTEEEQIIQDEDVTTSVSEINSIKADGDNIYLSTGNGFWICDSKKLCKELNEGLEADIASGNFQTFFTLKTNDNLFLAASRGIYSLGRDAINRVSTWQKISSGIQKLPDGEINARHLTIDKENNLWAATGTGIYKSEDNGKTWSNKSNGIKKNNNGFQEVFFLLNLEDGLYAACASGIYLFDKENNSWKDLTSGIRTKENSKKVYYLAKVQNNFFAATDEGLFEERDSEVAVGQDNKEEKIVLKGEVESDFADLEEIEPSVIEVQKQALRFSALPTNRDYKRYTLQAKLRNIVPKFGFDLNTTGTSTNYYQFNKGISANTSLNNDFNSDKTNRYQYDGKSFKQLSVTWNTDQLIYDDQIRYILNQARLTANIKENLLDDVTRIYYQRRRLQLDSILNPPQDTTDKLARQLEIAELTGQIDSRTGGWFSKEIEKRKERLVKNNDS